ncbi:hypothetical protein [Bradyrhizobium sp. STM 3557]|uniref:hypothetical protein n=1 Tax=Bradyrhizobium sp. STM 3557 TaxID=578920 RepID=UPI0038905EEB
MECFSAPPALIVPRRQFLRAFGLTAAGATLPISLLLAETPEQRVALQLAELTKVLQLLYPETRFATAWRHRNPCEEGCASLMPGEIIAVVKAAGSS